MRTALQNQIRYRRKAARTRAFADRHYRTVGYLDALLHASSRCPYPLETRPATEWLAGYAEGQREQAAIFALAKVQAS
jgi:hypothetical protein